MDNPGPTIISLCAGIGMLDEAVRLVFPGSKTACLCEWEAYAAAILLERMEDSSLEPAPIWCGDLRDFDGRPFRGVVDMLIAGLPCQPYSLAGQRKGNSDHRSHGADNEGPIPNFLRIVGECLPALVFLENVPAWVRDKNQWFRPVGEALCRMGYTLAQPVFVSAKSVGASHKRERVFILAYRLDHTASARHWRTWFRPSADIGSGERLLGEGRENLDNPGGSRPGKPGEPRTTGRPENRRGEKLGGRCSELGDADVASPDARPSSGGPRGATGQPSEHMGNSNGGSRNENCPRGNSTQSTDPELADPGNGQLSIPRRRPQGRSGVEPAGDALVNPQGTPSRPGFCEEGSQQHRNGASSSSRSLPGVGLADSCGTELEGRAQQPNPQLQAASRSRGPHLPLFAPGPQDPRWTEILNQHPHLAPAVEPGLRVLADGFAGMAVDASRADQLRCVGNSCVPLQAAAALVELLWNEGLI